MPENLAPQNKEQFIERQLLVMMVGIPGSGKTTFARQLAERSDAYRLNMDLLRGELYGTANRQEQKRYSQQARAGLDREAIAAYEYERSNQLTEAFNEKLIINLKAGRSIIIDSSRDNRARRDEHRRTAKQYDALSIIVWMQIPYERAIERATYRKLTADSYPFEEEHLAREEIDRCLQRLDFPGDDELCVRVDGQQSFNEQFASIYECCRQAISA